MAPDRSPDGNANSTGADPSPLTDARRRVRTALVRFVADLRASEVEVSGDGALVGAEALALVGLDSKTRVRTALRAALLSRPDDAETFDRLFDRFWRRVTDALERGEADLPGGIEDFDGGFAPGAVGGPDGDDGTVDESADAGGETVAGGAAGDAERAPGDDVGRDGTSHVERRDDDADGDAAVARFSPVGTSTRIGTADLGRGVDPSAAVRELADVLANRPGRRVTPAASGRPDVRRAMRRSHATGGAVVDVPERSPRPTAVRGLVLADVSRSVLDALDREFLLAVLRSLTAEWRATRTFLFDTELTELTDALRVDSPAAARAELDRLEAAWGGGTRIGHALTTIRERDPYAVDRETVVLVVSDGLETGELSRLETGMAWLDRRARRVYWLNPLAATEGYKPTARGMRTARPHLDGLFALAEPADLFDMARQLRDRRRPVGYEYDWRHETTP